MSYNPKDRIPPMELYLSLLKTKNFEINPIES